MVDPTTSVLLRPLSQPSFLPHPFPRMTLTTTSSPYSSLSPSKPALRLYTVFQCLPISNAFWLHFFLSQALQSHCFDSQPHQSFSRNSPQHSLSGQLTIHLLQLRLLSAAQHFLYYRVSFTVLMFHEVCEN